MSKEQNMSGIH